MTTGHHNSIIRRWGDDGTKRRRKERQNEWAKGEGRREPYKMRDEERAKGKRSLAIFLRDVASVPRHFFFLLFYANPSRTRPSSNLVTTRAKSSRQTPRQRNEMVYRRIVYWYYPLCKSNVYYDTVSLFIRNYLRNDTK